MLSEINAEHTLGITGDTKELENMLRLSRNPSLIPTLKGKLKVFFAVFVQVIHVKCLTKATSSRISCNLSMLLVHGFFMAPYMLKTAVRWITVSAKGLNFFLPSFPKAFHGHRVSVLVNLPYRRFF